MSSGTTIRPQLGEELTGVLEFLGRTTDAMVAIDGEMRIIAWNEAATTLLGHAAIDAMGQPCHEIMGWSDRCGNTICHAPCRSMALEPDHDQLIETRDMLGRTADGQNLWLNASTIVPPADIRDRCWLVHLAREIALPPELERLIGERLQATTPAPNQTGHLDVLTPRQREVLQLLTEGLDGAAIAEALFVSPATVRNHIQHILTKLSVHNRVEAVAFALRNG